MEDELERQPLDLLMGRHGLSNADLVRASTEQLSFKMVHKGRSGRRLSPNIQDKILRAFLKAKPDLKLRRRDLFRYEIGEDVVERIQDALAQIRSKKIDYPGFVDLLGKAGITRYTAEVPNNRVIFHGVAGEAHIEQGPAVSQGSPGRFNEDAIRSAIAETQKGLIDHLTFLKRIFEAGVPVYEVNIRALKIEYRGDGQSYKENIALPGTITKTALRTQPNKLEGPAKKRKKDKKKRLTTKARMALNKRRFMKRR